MQNIWFDFTNPPHVNFFLPFIRHFEKNGHKIQITAREFVETVKLLEINGLNYSVYGKHGGRSKLFKVKSLIERELSLLKEIKDFNFSFSSNYEAPLTSWLKRKPSLVFDDNDISPNWLYAKFAKYVISPCYINVEAMYRMGISKKQLITYNGFKENIYIADYKPSSSFFDKVPFSDFVTVRPENIKASYVPKGRKSIVPELIHRLTSRGINVLYLPRYSSDKELVQLNDRVFVPSSPLNGLDVCYYSKAVLTGAGTFSREAAVMGTPAVSFFAGDKFLGVDMAMFKKDMVYYSRDPQQIVEFVLKSEKKDFSSSQSKVVQNELFEKVDLILNS